MGNRRPTTEHRQVVARRLAQLDAELSAARGPLEEPTRPRNAHPMPDTHTRVPQVATEARQRVPGPLLPVPEVRPPGRHAARRKTGRLDLVPTALRGRVALGPPQVAVIAVVVAVGLAVTTWWVVRGDAREVTVPVVTSTPADLVAPATSGAPLAVAGTTAAEPSGRVTVDVAGKVHRPGIVVLDAGARVIDALEAAGGPRRGVDLTSLNLARLLVDGEQLLVGMAGPVGAAGSSALPSAAPGVDPLVNLNTADLTLLETLPDVGPVTAQAIIDWRTEHGGFTAVAELLEVDGIGDATLATITPHVTV